MRHKAQDALATSSIFTVAVLTLVLTGAGPLPRGTATAPALGTTLLAAADSCDSVFAKARVGWATREYKGALRQWVGDVAFSETHVFLTLNSHRARGAHSERQRTTPAASHDNWI